MCDLASECCVRAHICHDIKTGRWSFELYEPDGSEPWLVKVDPHQPRRDTIVRELANVIAKDIRAWVKAELDREGQADAEGRQDGQ